MATQKPKQPNHEEIALRAFELWTKEGYPMGNDQRHWLQAEAELKSRAVPPPPNPAARTPKRAVALMA